MLAEDQRAWLDAQAATLDVNDSLAAAVVPFLAESQLLGYGVPGALGGRDGKVSDAIEAIAEVATHSLAAAFAFWGQRVLIQLLVETENTALRERYLAPLLAGEHAGASGLSNVMKFLSGIESLNITASASPEGGWVLDGIVPWCTNLRKQGFWVAVAVARDDGAPPMIVALPSDRPGVVRSDDLDLMALRGTNTASLQLNQVRINETDLLAENASVFLPRVRPSFLGLQCGMSIGLARAALSAASARMGVKQHVLQDSLNEVLDTVNETSERLKTGVDDGEYVQAPQRLFGLRLALHECVQQAMQIELQASGGRAYLNALNDGFARRWRESAFIPIITPSVTQLLGELQKAAARAEVSSV